MDRNRIFRYVIVMLSLIVLFVAVVGLIPLDSLTTDQIDNFMFLEKTRAWLQTTVGNLKTGELIVILWVTFTVTCPRCRCNKE